MSDDDRALVVFKDSQDPSVLARLRALVNARAAKTPTPPAPSPAAYRGIPVPRGLHSDWVGVAASWWRQGVDATLDIAAPLVESLHCDSECSFDHHGYCREHGLPGAIPCPDGLARQFIAETREGGRTGE